MEVEDKCPECGAKWEVIARNFRTDRVCENGHRYHVCTVHHKLVKGHVNYTIPLERCTCNSYF